MGVLMRRIEGNITRTKNFKTHCFYASVYSKRDRKASKVGCDLTDQRVVTGVVRVRTGTAPFSTNICLSDYSGKVPKGLVKLTEIGVPTIIIPNKAVGTKPRVLALRRLNVCDTGCRENRVSRTGLS